MAFYDRLDHFPETRDKPLGFLAGQGGPSTTDAQAWMLRNTRSSSAKAR